jgi:amino acid adenylation domain-containing protein
MKRILTQNIIRSADQNPDKVAFKQLDRAISYEQLVNQSFKLANFLQDLGIRKGDRVGICMNRALESSFSTYGIMLAGAAYVPIDSNLPPFRIAGLLSDCDIKVVISRPEFHAKIEQICQESSPLKYVIGLDLGSTEKIRSFIWDDVMSSSDSSPSVSCFEDDMAYIMYTSGTTGRPKGIVHTHKSGFSYAKLSAELYHITQQDILGNHSQLHYDISTMGYLTMPYVGGCTVIIPEAYTVFPSSLGQLIESEKMTIWYSVPLALIQLLKSNALEGRDLKAIRWVLFGGEPFAIQHIKALFDYFPSASFSNVYGPAEVNQCTYFNFNKSTKLIHPVPIGRSWPETSVHISYRSTSGQEEDVGELHVSSSTQMKGYWNQPELTKKRTCLRRNRHGEEQLYFKTGDLVRALPNGDLVFVGRADRQIKVRGYRVELNEIESVLLSHPSIVESAVYAKKLDDAWAIYANVVSKDKSLLHSDIIKFLSKFLPSYALPMEIRMTESIPRTSAGKIDYKSLTQ